MTVDTCPGESGIHRGDGGRMWAEPMPGMSRDEIPDYPRLPEEQYGAAGRTTTTTQHDTST